MDKKVVGPGRVMWPDWSAANNQIALTFCSDALDGIAVMNADGTDYRVLVPEYGMIPRWSPDGTHIAFHGFFPSSQLGTGLFLMTAEGSDLRRLAVGQSVVRIQWSPDGQRIAYAGSNGGDSTQIKVLTVDGSAETITLPGVAGHSVAWAPNNRGLVYRPDGNLAVVNLESRQVFNIPYGTFPAWSAQGKLAYVVPETLFKSDSPIPPPGIYIMSSQRGGADHLGVAAESLLWSPDGTQLLFQGTWRQQEGVFVTDEHFGRVRLIVSRRELQVWDTCWSPDGTQILVRGAKNTGDEHYLYIFHV